MVDLCQEATQTTGPVSLFIGIESAQWHDPMQFVAAAQFAKQHGITCIFLKVFEVGSPVGDIWYGGMNGVDSIIGIIKFYEVACIPYGFLYGGDQLTKEIDVAKQLLSKYGVLCLDMEGQPWASAEAPNWAKQIATALEPIPGELWVSCPANPVESGHLPFLQAMLPATNVFMPMVYSDYLATRWEGDFKQVGATCVQPTIDLSGEFGSNNVPAIVAQIITSGAQALSIWEYQFAQQFAGAFDAAVSLLTGKQQEGTSLILNAHGEVANFIGLTQFFFNHSEFECGPFAVSHVKFATAPNTSDHSLQSDAQKWAWAEYAKRIGPDTPSDTQGSSIQNMDEFYKDAGLHWRQLPIDANSDHNQDIARIKAALEAGYLVIATVAESSVFDVGLNKNPYFWGPSGTHIIVYSGIAKSGNLLAEDTANVEGALQGNNFALPGPREYDASRLNNSYAAIIQTAWLEPTPSDDPLTWPQGFNAQNFGGSNVQPQTQPQGETAMQKQFDDVWSASPFVATGYKSGIYRDMLTAFLAKKISACFPASDEIDTTDWNGNAIKFQAMSNGLHAEWAAGKTKVYDALGHEVI